MNQSEIFLLYLLFDVIHGAHKKDTSIFKCWDHEMHLNLTYTRFSLNHEPHRIVSQFPSHDNEHLIFILISSLDNKEFLPTNETL